MNKDFKNLGIAFAISSLVDDIQLCKMEIPSKKLYVYTLNAKDKSFGYTIDIENNSNNLDSEKVLLDVLQKAYASLSGDKESKYTFDDFSIDEYIAHVLNMIKFKAKSAYDKFQNSSNLVSKFFGPEAEYLNQIDKTIVGISESYFEECDFQTNEYDVLENMFSTFDLIYGESGINPITLNKPIDSRDLEDYYEETSQKIQQLKEADASLKEYRDSVDPDMDMDEFISQIYGDLDEGEKEEQEDLPSFEELRNDVLMNKILPAIFDELKNYSEEDDTNNTKTPKQVTDNPEDGEDSSEQIR